MNIVLRMSAIVLVAILSGCCSINLQEVLVYNVDVAAKDALATAQHAQVKAQEALAAAQQAQQTANAANERVDRLTTRTGRK